MPILAGETLTAGRLNRLQPKTYWAAATSTLGPGVSNVDVPGATVTFTTETANAQVDITWFTDFDPIAAANITGNSSVLIDGTTASPVFAMFAGDVSNDRGTSGNSWVTTLPTIGSHTIKMRATTSASMNVNLYSSIKVVVTEVV